MEQNVEKKKKIIKRIYFAGMHFHFDDGNVILWSEFCDECYSTKRAGKPEKCSSSVSSTLLFCRGAYPDSLDYLKKHYGITWDESKYKVTYEIIAKNIRPEVKVIPLQESKK